MNFKGFCKICQHEIADHMHLKYDIRKATKVVLDARVDADHTKAVNHEQELKNFLKTLELYKQEYQEELQTCTDISAQFGCYLKQHAIVPVNDCIDNHLSTLIRHEKASPSRTEERLQNLKDLQKRYKERTKIIKEQMEQNVGQDFITSPEQIFTKLNILYYLKHHGSNIKEAFNEVEMAEQENCWEMV